MEIKEMLNWIPIGATLLLAPVALTASAWAGEESASAPVSVGQPAPDLELPDANGRNHRLSELRGEKNVVLVFFRGTW